MATNIATNTQAVTFNGFSSIQDKEFYERQLIQPLREENILGQFYEEDKMPKNHGKTKTWRKPGRITVPDSMLTNGLVEGVIPDPNSFSMTEYSVSIKRFGDHIPYSDEALEYGIDNLKDTLTTEMSYAYKDFIEKLRYLGFKQTKNYWVAGGAAPTASATLDSWKSTANLGVDLNDLNKIAAFMKRNKVRGGKNNNFVIVIPPEVTPLLLSTKKDSANFTAIEISNLQRTDVVYTGEAQTILKFSFVESNAIHQYNIVKAGASDSDSAAYKIGDKYYYGVKGTGAYNYVDCIVLGKVNSGWGAHEITLEGENGPEMILKGLGSSGTNDPLNQKGSIGWKHHGIGHYVKYDEAVMVYTCRIDGEYNILPDDGRKNFKSKVEFTGSATTTSTTAAKGVAQGTEKSLPNS